MRNIGFLGAVALLGAIACDSVLDIEEPKTRPEQSTGEGGEPTQAVAGTHSGGSTSGSAGSAGQGPSVELLGGAAGEGGDGGGAGAPPVAKDCEPNERRCTELTPEICDATGHWAANADEADGDCAVLCVEGQCAECEADAHRCTSCAEGAQNCVPSLPQTCVNGAWQDAASACKAYCDVGTGECVKPPSCTDSNAAQTTCKDSVSCCSSLLVPGGDFFRNYDGDEYAEQTLPASVSAFYLDKFEVTVGRFRQFLLAYEQLGLKEGDGKSAHIAEDKGWNAAEPLPAKADLLGALSGCSGTTWSDSTAPDDNTKPINCVPFNVAYAFCIWDGGRLPTETEWNFAAAGGSEQRTYPWRAPLSGPGIANEFANYGVTNPGPIPVGLTAQGDGRYGQSDLAGNAAEWTLDYFGDPAEECRDCLNATASGERILRGGSFEQDEYGVKASFRTSDLPSANRSGVGFRCARDLNESFQSNHVKAAP